VLFNPNYHLLILYDNNIKNITIDFIKEEYNIPSHLLLRTIFMNEIKTVEIFNKIVNEKYIQICGLPRELTRPVFSIFTSSFNSYKKIIRAFNSLKAQTLTYWEWIIIDDSPDDKHFDFLRKTMASDNRVRIYRRAENNGSIGNVKNEAVSLCRGEFVLELDHDDEILPFVLEESAALFKSNNEVGFIYMDFINIYENGSNYTYGDFICKGYGSYYCQKYNDKWVYVYNTPNVNNITLSHLVCCPNHPRIWRRNLLLNIGNYCEYLPICDDYEILLRTAINTKMAKIHKFGYIQYMNDSNNNFSLIRNAEINRIGPNFISPIYYDIFNIHEKMKELDAYEDEKYLEGCRQIWMRDVTTYKHKYCNLLTNPSYKTQYCIIGLNSLIKNIDEISELYKDVQNDFLILENKCSIEYLFKKIDSYGFGRMKCYTLIDVSDEILENYFMVTYCSVENPVFFKNDVSHLLYNTDIVERHNVINSLTKSNDKYLEIGVEYGITYSNTHFSNKVGVDPDPKCEFLGIEKYTSDEYFNKFSDKMFDVIFIDGMHQSEVVLRDLNNSMKILNQDGFIFIDDILPLNYNEQLKIPRKHRYENGILKYGEEWTGDVWKVIYHVLHKYLGNIIFGYFYNINYRGVFYMKIKEPFQIPEKEIEEINGYDYYNSFNHYLNLLSTLSQVNK
jgi:glycosyltransferase involved in cell wall biosynthesis